MTWVLKHPNYLPTYHVKEAKSWRECFFLCLCSRLWVERYDGFDAKFRVNWEYFLAGMEVGYYIIAAVTFPRICMKCCICSSSCQRSFLEFCDGFYRGECAFISPQTHTQKCRSISSLISEGAICVCVCVCKKCLIDRAEFLKWKHLSGVFKKPWQLTFFGQMAYI